MSKKSLPNDSATNSASSRPLGRTLSALSGALMPSVKKHREEMAEMDENFNRLDKEVKERLKNGARKTSGFKLK